MPVQVVTRDDDTAAVYIRNPPDVPGLAYRIFQAITDGGADVDMILQTASYSRKADIVFTVQRNSADAVEAILAELLSNSPGTEITVMRQCSRLCISGDGLCGRRGSAAELLRCLWDAEIRLYGVTSSDVTMTLLVDEEQADRASSAIAAKMSAGE